MNYYDKEYRQELISFLKGYKNILLYLKEKDEGIAEVLIQDNLKKLEEHIKIITPTKFELLNNKIRSAKKKQAEEYFKENLEVLKKQSKQQESPKSEILNIDISGIAKRLESIEQSILEIKKQENQESISEISESEEENELESEFTAQFEEPSALG